MKECWRQEWLCEYINNLVGGRYVMNEDIFVKNFFSNKVLININVFGSSMKNRIMSQRYSENIIIP